jgi:cytochrome c biogenesis protein CcmG/thiol:disulfide interchange protein DsbE
MKRFAGLAILLLIGVGMLAAADAEKAQKAPDFTLKDVAGKDVKLSELLKNGPVYMECWDLPCVNCIAELDALVPTYDTLKERGLQIIALSVDKPGDAARVKAFTKSKKWPYICLLDQQTKVKKAYGIIIKPTAYLINTKGEIVYTHIGYKKGDEKKIKNEFLRVLPEKPAKEQPAGEGE